MFITNYEPNPFDINYAPSAVFAIYYGLEQAYTEKEREFKLFQALSDFTHKTRMNADCTMIEIWGNGQVGEMMVEVKREFPSACILLIAN